MNGFLKSILARKRDEVQSEKHRVTVEELRDRPLYSESRRSLRAALRFDACAIIAEVKKASPSKGILRHVFDHKEIADKYVRGGASALSVLTDREYFQGDRSYLEDVRKNCTVPILRKDFIIDPYQLVESKAYGADAVLLIVAALAPQQLQELYGMSCTLGLESLVEVHSEEEISRLAGINASIVGVNNRNLDSFETDLQNSIRLRPLLPDGVVAVSESGIASADNVRELASNGYDAVLIGEMFMKSKDPGLALKRLKEELRYA